MTIGKNSGGIIRTFKGPRFLLMDDLVCHENVQPADGSNCAQNHVWWKDNISRETHTGLQIPTRDILNAQTKFGVKYHGPAVKRLKDYSITTIHYSMPLPRKWSIPQPQKVLISPEASALLLWACCTFAVVCRL